MKDTQGIVCSGAACTSCRDGYVLDLCDVPWKHPGHMTIKQPSGITRIPEMWILNIRDPIHRYPCHEPHIRLKALKYGAPSGGSADAPVATDREGHTASRFSSQPASPGADLCIVCHGDTAFLTGADRGGCIAQPSAKDLLRPSVAETGARGAYHAVHTCTLGERRR